MSEHMNQYIKPSMRLLVMESLLVNVNSAEQRDDFEVGANAYEPDSPDRDNRRPHSVWEDVDDEEE